MFNRIRYLFKAIDLDQIHSYDHQHHLYKILEVILKKKRHIQGTYKLLEIRAYLRKEILPHGTYQYISLKLHNSVEKYLPCVKQCLIVEFFHHKTGQAIHSKIKSMDSNLQKREKELKYLINELKDESSLFYAMEIISKTSKGSFSEFQDEILVNLIVSDPLVDSTKEHPLYYEQVDVSNHIQKLRQTSISDCSLSIKAKRYHANKRELLLAMNSQDKKQKSITIVEIFTRVEKIDNEIMMSLENNYGEQVWENAREILMNNNIELLIVIGIGAHLLEEVQYDRPLILLTSVSVEQNKLEDTTYSRDKFALTFLENLYQNIFKRQELGFCISQAKRYANEYTFNYLWCCCLHQHANDCSWQQIVRRIGNQQAHRLFKHSYQEWKGLKYYPINNALQLIIVGNNLTCSKDNICCWNRMNISKVELHQNINKVLLWNNKSYEIDQGMMKSLKLNKFQSEIYDKPIHRTRPLTIYRIIQLITLNKICILRTGIVTQARRFLTQASQYLRCRQGGTFFFELQMYKQIKIQKQIGNFIQSIKDINKDRLKVKLFISIIEKESLNSNYEHFMKEHQTFSQNIKIVYHLEVSLNFIIVTSNPSFEGEYATFTLTVEPDIKEKYYEILHKFKYENISPDNRDHRENLQSLREQILHGTTHDQVEIKQKCLEISLNSEIAYHFLGFLSLFGEDGLYLTKSTSLIIEQIFSKQVIDDAIHRRIPVQSFVFTNCVYLQISKSYREYFENVQSSLSDFFTKKQLEYYNILLRLYIEFMKVEVKEQLKPFIKSFIRKQGLFSICIEPQDQNYNEIIKKIRSLYEKQGEIFEIFYNHAIFKPIYHINQIQKILQQISRKKKVKQFQTIKISNTTEVQMGSTILLWNILQKVCVAVLTLEKQFEEKVKHLRMMIIVFLLKGEVKHTIIEIARIQLGLILDQKLRKLSEGINHQHLSQLLTYLHVYSLRLSSIDAFKPEWGSTHKFKETLYNCFSLVYKLKQSCETSEVRNEFRRFKTSVVIVELTWYRELMKLIQKKTLFYFNFIRMIRSQRYMRPNRVDEEKDFQKHLNLGEIRYEFQNLYLKFPQDLRKECDFLLLDHYIKISLNEANADNSLLFSLRSNISPQLESIYQHLCLKVDKKTLFNKKRLVIFARARNSFANGEPYIFNRKRYLTIPYLNLILEGTSLRSSYFNLHSKTIPQLYNTNLLEILFLLVNIDSNNTDNLLIGSQSSVESESISVDDFASQIIKLPIRILVFIGRDAVSVCQKIRSYYDRAKKPKADKVSIPIIIALQSSRFSMNDYHILSYPIDNSNHAWNYLSNEVYLMGMDLIALSIVWRINEGLKIQKMTYSMENITKIVNESIKNVKMILSTLFECVEETFATFNHKIWAQPIIIEKIEEGTFEDLTSKFYTSEYNFYNYNYYENVGRCDEISKIIQALRQKKCVIQIKGKTCTGKTTIFHQASWTAQIKNLFEFGISIFDLSQNVEGLKQFILNCKFKDRAEGISSCVLIAIDNLSEKILEQQKEIFEKLKNKSVTIMFTAENNEVGAKLRSILSNSDGFSSEQTRSVDMNKIEMKDVYGLLMSYIKDLSEIIPSENEMKYTRNSIHQFQRKVQEIMSKVTQADEGTQICMSIELLKGIKPISSQKKHEIFYNFYKVNYDNLLIKLKEKKEMKVKII